MTDNYEISITGSSLEQILPESLSLGIFLIQAQIHTQQESEDEWRINWQEGVEIMNNVLYKVLPGWKRPKYEKNRLFAIFKILGTQNCFVVGFRPSWKVLESPRLSSGVPRVLLFSSSDVPRLSSVFPRFSLGCFWFFFVRACAFLLLELSVLHFCANLSKMSRTRHFWAFSWMILTRSGRNWHFVAPTTLSGWAEQCILRLFMDDLDQIKQNSAFRRAKCSVRFDLVGFAGLSNLFHVFISRSGNPEQP